MILKLKYFFSAILIVLTLASCSKEYSDESGLFGNVGNSSGTAIFTLSGAPNSCATAIVNATYIAGVALGDSNTVIISVNVDSVGTYAITTGTINGISFNASGTFTTKGVQNVTLLGSGTPIAGGSFTFTPGANGCSFSMIVTSASTGTGGGTPAPNFLTCGIGGVDSTFDSSLAATTISLSGLESIAISGMDSSSNASFTITLNTQGTIATGTYNLLSITHPTATFCSILYTDNNSNVWGGAASSQAGTFEVTVTNITLTRIEGTFSGTLYDNAGTGSNSKVITNGQFSAPIQ